MKITKEQREALKDLAKHRWYKVLEDLVVQMRESLYKRFDEASLWDEAIRLEINSAQNQLKGAKYLLDTVKQATTEIAKTPTK